MQRRAFLDRLALTAAGLLVAPEVLEQLTHKRRIFPSAWPEGLEPAGFDRSWIPGEFRLIRARFNFDREVWEFTDITGEEKVLDWVASTDDVLIHTSSCKAKPIFTE